MQQLLEGSSEVKRKSQAAGLKNKKRSFALTTMEVEDDVGSKKSEEEEEDYGDDQSMEEEVNNNSKQIGGQKINNLVYTSDGVLVVSGAFIEVIITYL